jgi:hypothetical protein
VLHPLGKRIAFSHALQRGSFRLGCFDDFFVLWLPCAAAMSTSHGPGERGSSSLRIVCDKKVWWTVVE